MPLYDPRVLALILEDLLEELQRWATHAADLAVTARFHQRQLDENVERALHRARIVQTRAQTDLESVGDAVATVQQLLGRCEDAMRAGDATYGRACDCLEESGSTLSHWLAELSEAEAWLARARERVRRAEIALSQAEARLASAKAELAAARYALRSCESSSYTDSNGRRHRPNCSGQRSRVYAAAQEVESAEAAVNLAWAELQAAREEEARAEARVSCCRQAVAHARRAVSLAEESRSRAVMAVDAADRSQEYGEAGRIQVEVAGRRADAEMLEAEETMRETRSAEEHSREAAVHHRRADEAEESAQRMICLVRPELQDKVENLLLLARPEERLV